MSENDEYYDIGEYAEESADVYAEDAKEALRELFEGCNDVFYVRQLQVLFEKRFFHWVLARAIRELVADDVLREAWEELKGATRVKFVYRRGHRYYKRQIKDVLEVVRAYSETDVAIACGHQAETLFLNGFALRGFVPRGTHTRSFEGMDWTETNHNLDFMMERDEVVYGCEVKNTWGYIDGDEMRVKIRLCQFLGVVPCFIMRYEPKSYLEEIRQEGGVFVLFVAQVYPISERELVRKIREDLGLPADTPRAIPDGILDRFVGVHERRTA